MKEEQLYEELFEGEKKKVDYKGIIVEYVLRWPFILGFLVLSMLCAYVYLRYQPPVYNVSSTVMIKQGDKTKSTAATASRVDARPRYDVDGQQLRQRNRDTPVVQLIKKVVRAQNFYIIIPTSRSSVTTSRRTRASPSTCGWLLTRPSVCRRPLSVDVDCRKDGSVAVTAVYAIDGDEHTVSKEFKKVPGHIHNPRGHADAHA